MLEHYYVVDLILDSIWIILEFLLYILYIWNF